MSGGFWGYQRARISASNPQSLGRCDRCGFVKNLRDLRFQFYYQGPTLQNTNVLVCSDSCLDVPNPQGRVIVIPPDPVPLLNPRPEDYAQEIPNFFTTEDSTLFPGDSTFFISEDGLYFIAEDTLESHPGGTGEILMESSGKILLEDAVFFIELE